MINHKLAIIGGAGPYASALLYQSLLEELYKNKKEIFEMLIFNYPFTPPFLCKDPLKYELILQHELQYCVDTFLSAGIHNAVVVCNTLHAILDKIKGNISFIHLPKVVIENILSHNKSKLLILGTSITLKNGLYNHPHFETVIPNSVDQKNVERAITNVLNGKILKKDSDILKEIMKRATKLEKIDGCVLGCTELPVLHHHFPIKSSCMIFDTLKLLSNRLVAVSSVDKNHNKNQRLT